MITDTVTFRCTDCHSNRITVRPAAGPRPPSVDRLKRPRVTGTTYAEPDFINAGFTAIDAANASGVPWQAFDLEDRYGLTPPQQPTSWGVLFNVARNQGRMVYAGTARDRRPGSCRQAQLWTAP